jgi:hypothetical protein
MSYGITVIHYFVDSKQVMSALSGSSFDSKDIEDCLQLRVSEVGSILWKHGVRNAGGGTRESSVKEFYAPIPHAFLSTIPQSLQLTVEERCH